MSISPVSVYFLYDIVHIVFDCICMEPDREALEGEKAQRRVDTAQRQHTANTIINEKKSRGT